MNKMKWILVLLGLTLSINAFSRSAKPRRLTACVLEDLATSGLGDVKYSILSEAKFKLLNGTGWVLMQGQDKAALGIDPNDTEPSVFNYLTAADNDSLITLPDGRGVFFRGKNNTSSVIKMDTAGDRKLGNYQEDQFQEHSHSYGGLVVGSGIAGGGQYNFASTPTSVAGLGAKETRPRNITVNAFVKVKRNCLDAVTTNMINANTANIDILLHEREINKCDQCITITEDSDHIQQKLTCFKDIIEWYEADKSRWSVSCTARTVGYAKRVLMLIGVNRTADDNAWLSHLDNEYPYYNVVTVQ